MIAEANFTIKRQVRVKNIALPTEHGSWGFLLEPLVASLIIAPSIDSIWIIFLIVGAFLIRQPLKILISDLLAKRKLPQTAIALEFSIIYGTIFLLGLIGSIYFVSLRNFFPFIFILPLAIYQIYCDVNKQSRQLLPELTGAITISSSAAVIGLVGGVSIINSYLLWAIFVARLIPSILYVRNRLRLEKEKEFSILPVWGSHFIAFGAMGILAGNGLVPKLPIIMFLVLLIRAFWGLSPFRKRVNAMRIGVWEVIYGFLTAFSVVLGFLLKI